MSVFMLVLGCVTLFIAVEADPVPYGADRACAEVSTTKNDMPGPYFEPGVKLTKKFAKITPDGEPLILKGQVFDQNCFAKKNAIVDVWYAGRHQNYTFAGQRLDYRGKTKTDNKGEWAFTASKPQVYPGRPRHIHVKVETAEGRSFITQIYFQGEKLDPRNQAHVANYGEILPVKRGKSGKKYMKFIIRLPSGF